MTSEASTVTESERVFEPGTCRMLVVDDEADVRLGLAMLAEALGAEVKAEGSAEDALARLQTWTPHVIVSDITMPGLSGLELLDEVHKRLPRVRVILVTGFGTIDMAVSAMHRGASHFITKPFDNDEMQNAMRSFGMQALMDERVRSDRTRRGGSSPFISRDARMTPVLERIAQVAPTSMSVLITGESGVGKELVALATHRKSAVHDKPFLAVNTAALPDTLLESELFGHKRGAFTGAVRDRKGIFEQADGGTVFLDEIGLMSRPFQGKLLRVLQERKVVPLGTSRPVSVDFRLIAATAQDLEQRMAEGAFREDLYYRLNVVTIDVPPLRERPEDITALAMHFMAKYAEAVPALRSHTLSLSSAALEALRNYAWPGNVRELENCIQRALVVSDGGEIRPAHLGLGSGDDADTGPLPYEQAKQQAVQMFQRSYIERALREAEGNVTRAAQTCGMTRAALQRIMRSLDIERESFAQSS